MLSHEDFARYGRQILLAEVGREGQARLKHGVARVGGETLAHRVAALYAERAGFATIEEAPIDVESLAPPSSCARSVTREILAGARAATQAFRETTRGQEVSR